MEVRVWLGSGVNRRRRGQLTIDLFYSVYLTMIYLNVRKRRGLAGCIFPGKVVAMVAGEKIAKW
jgi:hypothetical protein